MSKGLENVLLLVPVFLFSLCAHEFAHAWMAMKRGDNTAARAGRLTLHPMAHADIVGTLILPIICIFNGWPFFGWAKPVPTDIRNMKYGRRDMALVAAAGPLCNFILALLSTGLLAILVRLPWQSTVLETTQLFAVVSIQVNIMLALFNLIPIPPLDGFSVLQGMLPKQGAMKLYRLVPYANMILLLLLVTGGFRVIAGPAHTAFRFLLEAAGAA